MSDYSSPVVHSVAKVLELSRDIEEKLQGYLVDKHERPDISYELLKILTIADDLTQLVDPEKISGEFFGLPKDVVAGSKEPVSFSNNLGWDFGPWFSEKSTSLKKGIQKVIKNWDCDPNTVNLVSDAPMSKNEYLRYGIDSGLHEVKTYAKVIFDQLFSDQVNVDK
ncbi:hypothetical protein [Lentibacillus jeotgali]|uniref:hypothetical protein n=1 Tax=Lentibacillus jeotgali TaxID=558169 RepID=UPI000262703C|nr:hypothetical protein [Lentibacillus jeotgali]